MSSPEIVVFLGPTLSVAEARRHLDAVYLPPAARGDVYRAARRRPWAIGLVDGYFERVPAVLHKEILWALAEGVHVVGAASMGALRAAELEVFGMEGVGEVFAAFRAGELDDDDEVAVVHGPAEAGFQAASEALVNVRWTLAAAEAAGVLAPEVRQALIGIAKSLYYPERTFPGLLRRAAREGLPQDRLAALESWLPRNRVDQKRADALALLHHLRERRDAGTPPKPVRFRFQHTLEWEMLRREAQQREPDPGGRDRLADAALEELGLQGDLCLRSRETARARALALELAAQLGIGVDSAAVEAAAERFRRERGLFNEGELRSWLGDQEMSPESFALLMRDEALIGKVLQMIEVDLDPHLRDHLRTTGAWGALQALAREKQRLVAARGLENPSLADAGCTDEELWRWFFEERLGRPRPADLDTYARSLGFTGEDALRRAVLRERELLRPCQ